MRNALIGGVVAALGGYFIGKRWALRDLADHPTPVLSAFYANHLTASEPSEAEKRAYGDMVDAAASQKATKIALGTGLGATALLLGVDYMRKR